MNTRRRKKFKATKEVRRHAREKLGSPPPTKIIQNKRHKPPKHRNKQVEQEES